MESIHRLDADRSALQRVRSVAALADARLVTVDLIGLSIIWPIAGTMVGIAAGVGAENACPVPTRTES